MRFICFGFIEETACDQLPASEQAVFMDACFAYDDELRRGGNFVDGLALQSAQNAVTVRHKNGKTAVTDGPFAETKEQVGGIMFLEARDLNHAIQLISNHPGIHGGGFRNPSRQRRD